MQMGIAYSIRTWPNLADLAIANASIDAYIGLQMDPATTVFSSAIALHSSHMLSNHTHLPKIHTYSVLCPNATTIF